MEKVVFYDREEIWPDNSIECPEFPSIQSLEQLSELDERAIGRQANIGARIILSTLEHPL